MKKIIITSKQLFEGVRDSLKTQVGFTGSNPAEMGANAAEKYNDALRTGLKPNSIQLNGTSDNNNADDSNETVINVNGESGNIQQSITNSIQNAVNNGADLDKINVKTNTEDITNPGMTEGVEKYSKKALEEMRLTNLRKNGTTYTKKSLRESFKK